MMLTRIFTGLALITASLLVFGFYRIPIVIITVICTCIAAAGAEFLAMCWANKSDTELKTPKFHLEHWLFGGTYTLPFFLNLALPYYVFNRNRFFGIAAALVAVLLLLVAAYAHKKFKEPENSARALIAFLAGFIYIGVPGLIIGFLSTLDAGRYLFSAPFWFIVAVVYMGDTGAYFTGVTIGKHKLIPSISPKKTWEGSVGGLLWSAGTAALLNWQFGFQLHWLTAICTGIAVGLSGQIGDLIESAFKRVSGCKDSGWIFPGHGGMLDRIDSLLLAAPICYGIFIFTGLVQ